jgi:hypothetical protein
MGLFIAKKRRAAIVPFKKLPHGRSGLYLVKRYSVR